MRSTATEFPYPSVEQAPAHTINGSRSTHIFSKSWTAFSRPITKVVRLTHQAALKFDLPRWAKPVSHPIWEGTLERSLHQQSKRIATTHQIARMQFYSKMRWKMQTFSLNSTTWSQAVLSSFSMMTMTCSKTCTRCLPASTHIWSLLVPLMIKSSQATPCLRITDKTHCNKRNRLNKRHSNLCKLSIRQLDSRLMLITNSKLLRSPFWCLGSLSNHFQRLNRRSKDRHWESSKLFSPSRMRRLQRRKPSRQKKEPILRNLHKIKRQWKKVRSPFSQIKFPSRPQPTSKPKLMLPLQTKSSNSFWARIKVRVSQSK